MTVRSRCRRAPQARLSLGLGLALCVIPVTAAAQAAEPPATQAGSQAATTAGGATGQAGSTTAPPAATPLTNISLDRIRLGEDRPMLDLTQSQVRFYSLVTAEQLNVDKVLGGKDYDLLYGPTRGGAAMTHAEFLKMVTPEELYSSAGIKADEMLQWSLVNIVGHAILRKLLTELKEARTEREVREIRQRIDKELETIRRNGGGGLD